MTVGKYRGEPEFRHDAPAKTGILITNLGTPAAATTKAVRRYLAEFLSDPRVIEMSRPLWWLVLHGVILRLRPRRSAAAYRKIWTDAGAPLLNISKQQVEGLRQRLANGVKIELGMRYGEPSLAAALDRLAQRQVRRLLVFPLYPQYSATTTASTMGLVFDELKKRRWIPELRTISGYYDDPGYISVLSESIRLYQAQHGAPERLLFSFHGLPNHYFLAGDPYFCQCQKTARLVASELGLPESAWQVGFQSRFGRREWLQPYTDKLLQQWASAGVRNIQVVCPGFSADCLETLEEVAMQYRSLFLAAGGKEFGYIPALNDGSLHLEMLVNLVERHCAGWDLSITEDSKQEAQAALARAQTLGADK